MFIVTPASEELKKQRFRERITEYMERAEKLKLFIAEENQGQFGKVRPKKLIITVSQANFF